MNTFTVFTRKMKTLRKKIRQNKKADFWCRVAFFYLIFVAFFVYQILSKDSAAPTFIYEAF